MEDEYEKKKRQEEMAKRMRESWAKNAPGFEKGFKDEDGEERKSQWKNLKAIFGG